AMESGRGGPLCPPWRCCPRKPRFRSAATALLVLAALVLPALAGARPAAAQGQAPGIPEVTVSLAAEPTEAGPGATVTVRTKVAIAPGWHIYGLREIKDGPAPSRFTWKTGAALRADGPPSAPAPQKKLDQGFGLEVDYYEGEVVFEQRFRVDEAAPAGPLSLTGEFAFGACDADSCYPPATIPLTVPLTILGASLPETQPQPEPDPAAPRRSVRFEARADRAEARAGEWVELRIAAETAPGYHFYSFTLIPDGPLPTTLDLKPGKDLIPDGAVRAPAPHRALDPGFGKEVETFAGKVEFVQRLRVAPGAAPGRAPLAGRVKYMACTEMSCDPPASAEFEVAWTIVAGAARPEFALVAGGGAGAGAAAGTPSPAGSGSAPPADPDDLLGKGFGPFLAACLIGGLVMLVMPCTYPMIPLTISFFTKRAGDAHTSTVGLAAVYALGIVLSFTGLGLVLSIALGAQGAASFAANPWINFVIGALFVYFAGTMLGFYPIWQPAFLSGLAGRAAGAGGYAGVLLMGLTFAIAAFACVGPLVAPLLVAAAAGKWFWPALGMAVASSVCGAAFFVLALFPGLIKKLPQGGGWLNMIEATFGFIELAAAFKFLSNADLVWSTGVLPRAVFLWIWIAIFAGLTLYLLGAYRLPHDQLRPAGRPGPGRLLSGLGAGALTVLLVMGVVGGAPLGLLEAFVPPPPANVASGGNGGHGAGLLEYDNLPDALAAAQAAGKPVFVDFTAFT
ncbi:MAG: hypothetical protein HZA54_07810, partial [Planctomycetes bacterium]|nr:hypothetical protein [Planctomycetota bacterium]